MRPTSPYRATPEDTPAPGSNAGRWLRRYGPPPTTAEATLVCLPHAGGAPTFFRDWPAHLAPSLDVIAVCYPGRQDRFDEPCVTDMTTMAGEVAAAVVPLAERGPLALFGHSMGAAVAYETARLLQSRRGIRPAHLFVSGLVPPHRVLPGIRHLKSDAALASDLLEQGGTDSRVLADEELRALVMPAVRADYELIETYRHVAAAEPLDVPITAYFGRDDARTPPTVMPEWRLHTNAPTETRFFAGGHFYLQQQRRELTKDIRSRLEPCKAHSSMGCSHSMVRNRCIGP
ncbi:thioesterase II family protein [Streptomyces sp. NPDC059944]|uniref:thioesterase II family protein n=1 Tax=unclassified Streptomyces TaxID=2593676 RepID=UPI00366262D4